MTSVNREKRLHPCYLLLDNDISCVVWFEDALAHYGVPTVLFDLFILVNDIEEAAELLVEKGWTLLPGKPKLGNDFVNQIQHRLIHHSDCNDATGTHNALKVGSYMRTVTETVLLQASDWNFLLPDHNDTAASSTAPAIFYPPLSKLLDGLLESFLDANPEENGFWLRLGVYISYLYAYVPALKDPSFANSLRYEHRQYHFDRLSGMRCSTLAFHRHQRIIREKLRQGKYQLRECSASRDNEDLFTTVKEARLLASMPRRPTPDQSSSASEEDDDTESGLEE